MRHGVALRMLVGVGGLLPLACVAVLGVPDSESLRSDASVDSPVEIGPRFDADFEELDAGLIISPIETDAGDASAPEGGTRCYATSAFVPLSGSGGSVCDPDNIFHGAPGPAGLDRPPGGAQGEIDGRKVTGCVGGKFAGPMIEAFARVSSTSKACETSCSGEGCGTGRLALVFGGTGGPFTYLGSLALSPAAADFAIPLGGLRPTEIVLCRGGYGQERDDVNVNEIWGTCLP